MPPGHLAASQSTLRARVTRRKECIGRYQSRDAGSTELGPQTHLLGKKIGSRRQSIGHDLR